MAALQQQSCSFFLLRKNRCCRMKAAAGRRYCGEHADQEEGGTRRIVCPLDPKHTVYEEKLQKHLKKCNSRDKPKPVYYVENVNAGPAGGGGASPQVSLSDCSRSELESLLDKLQKAVEGLQWDLQDAVLSHPIFQDELANPKNGDSAHKHLRQQSSILGHLQQLGLLGRGRCFLEFGAGRGKLSHWIHEALKTQEEPEPGQDLQLLLVERSSTRFKVDGKHQDSAVQFQRLQVDIQHLDLSKVPLLQQKKLPLVGVGKHLCGAATDLALRCLLERPGLGAEMEPPLKCFKSSENTGSSPGPGPDLYPGSGPGPVLGLLVALCCHHRCQWRHYVGQRFFQQRGLGPAEFSAFCRMSSWATCGFRSANQEEGLSQESANGREGEDNHELVEGTDAVSRFLSEAERKHVGVLCKRLIDAGRRDFLRTRGFSSSLQRYVSSHVTLENVLLTATPSLVDGHAPFGGRVRTATPPLVDA